MAEGTTIFQKSLLIVEEVLAFYFYIDYYNKRYKNRKEASMANRRDVLKCCAAASLTGIAPLSKAVEGKTLSSIMFEPCVAGGLSLKGRVIRSSVLVYAYEADGYADR